MIIYFLDSVQEMMKKLDTITYNLIRYLIRAVVKLLKFLSKIFLGFLKVLTWLLLAYWFLLYFQSMQIFHISRICVCLGKNDDMQESHVCQLHQICRS